MNFLRDIKNEHEVKLHIKAKRVKGYECDGCYFQQFGSCDTMKCTPTERKDKKNIIWELVE
jgi:hypothetical protein